MMKPLRLGVAAGALVVGLATGAHAFECALSNEADALEARVIQNHAMVAALTCGQQSRYNSFVRKFQGELVTHGTVLRQFFKRAYGSQANFQLNRFVTSLANRESRRSLTDRAAYCSAAMAMFDDLGTLKPGYLADFAGSLPVSQSQNHGFQACVQRAANDQQEAAAAR